jgi:VIT1/CCC1 family predicted Fe2+/Mn2+ transporter
MNKFLLCVIVVLVVLAILGWLTSVSSTLTIYSNRFSPLRRMWV